MLIKHCAVCAERSSDPPWEGTHRYGPVEHIYRECIPSDCTHIEWMPKVRLIPGEPTLIPASKVRAAVRDLPKDRRTK